MTKVNFSSVLELNTADFLQTLPLIKHPRLLASLQGSPFSGALFQVEWVLGQFTALDNKASLLPSFIYSV